MRPSPVGISASSRTPRGRGDGSTLYWRSQRTLPTGAPPRRAALGRSSVRGASLALGPVGTPSTVAGYPHVRGYRVLSSGAAGARPGSDTRSPAAQLCELRAGRRGPTPPGRAPAAPDATRPVSLSP